MRLIKTDLTSNGIVCVSGGCDSISAAHFLLRKFQIKKVYHFNHGTSQSTEMEKSVKRFCEDYGFDLILKKSLRNLKTEAEFRMARFEYFQENPNNYIMAHTLDEAVESYCLKFFVGKAEYLPIPLVTDLGNGGKILHPFLLVEKKSFRKYIEVHGLQKYVVEDQSNYDINASRRAWIRHEFLPQLMKKNIGLKKIVRKMYLQKI